MTVETLDLAVSSSANRRAANLRRLLAPKTIAVIGGAEAAEVVRQCRAVGYGGTIRAVSRRRAEIGGIACVASVEELPEAPDAAFVAVPREATIETVRALRERGAGGCVCYAAGFAEAGGEGVALQRSLAEAAGDLALMGPNCYGLLNLLEGVALWPDFHGCRRVEGGAAIVSQSGNIGINVTMQDRGLPISHMVSVGNQALLGLGDFVEALAGDPRVTAIGLIMEGVSDVERFSRAAAAALEKGVPIVALKCGHSEAGARLTLSHTSSLAGDSKLYGALYERLGIVEVGSLPKLIETLKLLTVTGTRGIERFASLSCSGGEAALVADLAHELGIAMPGMSDRQTAALHAQLPSFVTISNPFDYNTTIWADRDGLERCFATVMVESFDAVALILDFPPASFPGRAGWDAAVEALIAARDRTAAGGGALGLLVSSFPELMPAEVRARAVAAGIVPLLGLEEAMTAVAAAGWYAARRRTLDQAPVVLARPRALTGTPRLLDEHDAKERLAAHGLAIPEGRAAAPAEVPGAAAALGYPLVLKALSPALPHKTEAGAVRLGLGGPAELEAALAEMAAGLAARGIVPARFLVERMVPDAVAELIVGVKRDERLGLALVIGSGGQLVELVGDSASLLLPTDRAAVERALDGLKAARLIAGFRGRPAGDRAAAVDAILAVASYAEAERARLVELDVNPLLVLPEGRGAVAVDALVRLADA